MKRTREITNVSILRAVASIKGRRPVAFEEGILSERTFLSIQWELEDGKIGESDIALAAEERADAKLRSFRANSCI